jgi:hypothetical protein
MKRPLTGLFGESDRNIKETSYSLKKSILRIKDSKYSQKVVDVKLLNKSEEVTIFIEDLQSFNFIGESSGEC